MQFRVPVRTIVAVLVIGGLHLSACAKAPSATHEKPAAVDKDKMTVTLTEKAGQRIEVATTLVTEAQVARTRKLGAKVVGAPKSAASSTTADGAVWVRVSLNASDIQAMDPKQPARLLSIDSDDSDDKEEAGLDADLDERTDDEDDAGTDSDRPIYFKVKGGGAQLKEGQPALLEVKLQGAGVSHRLIPYSALVYDVKGATWVYVRLAPNVFQRQKVTVDYIKGAQAHLLDGPAVGTPVVSQGVAEIYGAETGVGK